MFDLIDAYAADTRIKRKIPEHEKVLVCIPEPPKPSRFRRKKVFTGDTALNLSKNYCSRQNEGGEQRTEEVCDAEGEPSKSMDGSVGTQV